MKAKKPKTKKTKETEEIQVSKFFKFLKPGDSISGAYKGLYTGKYGLSLRLELKDGTEKYVGLNNIVLKNIVGDNLGHIQNSENGIIKITFTQLKGRVKMFTAEINKVELFSSFELKEATEDEIGSFFSDTGFN